MAKYEESSSEAFDSEAENIYMTCDGNRWYASQVHGANRNNL